MKAINIHFGRLRPTARRWAAGLLLLGIGIAVGASWRFLELEATESYLKEVLLSSKKASEPIAVTRTDLLQQNDLDQAQRVIEQIDYPWNVLFSAIDATYDEQVTLLGLEPEPERHEVRITAEAKDVKAMLTYLRQLYDSPVFSHPALISHQVNQQDPLRPVRFVINTAWKRETKATSDPVSTERSTETGDVNKDLPE